MVRLFQIHAEPQRMILDRFEVGHLLKLFKVDRQGTVQILGISLLMDIIFCPVEAIL